MLRFIRNIWNAQKNASEIEWLKNEIRSLNIKVWESGMTIEAKDEALQKQNADHIQGLVMTLAVEYRRALGNPTEDLPDSIKEAHATRGALTGWKFGDDRLLGRTMWEKMAKRDEAAKADLARSGWTNENK